MIAYSRRNLLLIRYSTTIDEERKPPRQCVTRQTENERKIDKSTDSNLSAIRPVEAKYARVDYISDACDGCMCVYVYTMDFCRVSNSDIRRDRLFRACALSARMKRGTYSAPAFDLI